MKVRFYGAFGSKAKAQKKKAAVGGTIKKFRVRGKTRYAVMRRKG